MYFQALMFLLVRLPRLIVNPRRRRCSIQSKESYLPFLYLYRFLLIPFSSEVETWSSGRFLCHRYIHLYWIFTVHRSLHYHQVIFPHSTRRWFQMRRKFIYRQRTFGDLFSNHLSATLNPSSFLGVFNCKNGPIEPRMLIYCSLFLILY